MKKVSCNFKTIFLQRSLKKIHQKEKKTMKLKFYNNGQSVFQKSHNQNRQSHLVKLHRLITITF